MEKNKIFLVDFSNGKEPERWLRECIDFKRSEKCTYWIYENEAGKMIGGWFFNSSVKIIENIGEAYKNWYGKWIINYY